MLTPSSSRNKAPRSWLLWLPLSTSKLIKSFSRLKLNLFMDQYEKLVERAAIPRSARFMDLEDKDGYQLWRFVVLTTKVDNYLNEARKAGLTVKRFQYDFQKYKLEQETKVKLEHQMESLKVTYSY